MCVLLTDVSDMGKHNLVQVSIIVIVLTLVVKAREADAFTVTPRQESQNVEDEEEIDTYYKELELERLKQSILRGLGLTKIPDVSKMNVSEEEYNRMYQVYLRSVEQNQRKALLEEERVSQIVAQRFYSFTHTDDKKHRVRRSISSDDASWVYFPVEIPEATQNLKADVNYATLRLFLYHSPKKNSHSSLVHGVRSVFVKVYQLMNPTSKNSTVERLLIDHREIELDSSRWTEFDVTRALESWIRRPESNLGLEIECDECASYNFQLVTGNSEYLNNTLCPVLNILTSVHSPSRSKRSTFSVDDTLGALGRRFDCRNNEQRCCGRHPLKVVFKQLTGFGFILQPKEIDVGYCKGRCPPTYKVASSHALLQGYVSRQNKKVAPKPCCAPSKLRSIEILHYDENSQEKLKVSNWADVQVESCACS